jgi:hypothetical protein
VLGGCATIADRSAAADEAEVRRLIDDGARACAAGNPAGSMRAVDRDLRLSYPGTPDQGYDELAAGYARLCAGSGEGTVTSTVPEFEEVVRHGDIIVARLTWATHLRGMPEGTVRRLRDFQVWRRTAEGWRMWRGVHWPFAEAAR